MIELEVEKKTMIFNKNQGFYLRKLKPRYRMKDTYLDNTYEKELTITLIINYVISSVTWLQAWIQNSVKQSQKRTGKMSMELIKRD